MREIKFRAWDNKKKEWLLGYNYKSLGGFSLFGECILLVEWGHILDEFILRRSSDDLKVMQYTGLKDKNGKEVYEGDIIKKQYKDKPYSEKAKTKEILSEVVWREGCNVQNNDFNNKTLKKDPSAFNEEPCFGVKRITKENNFYCCNWSGFSGCEVIGNIYENTELLK